MSRDCSACRQRQQCMASVLSKHPALCERPGGLNETETAIIAYISAHGPTRYNVICEALVITKAQYNKSVRYCRALGLLNAGRSWQYNTPEQQSKIDQIILWKNRWRAWIWSRNNQ